MKMNHQRLNAPLRARRMQSPEKYSTTRAKDYNPSDLGSRPTLRSSSFRQPPPTIEAAMELLLERSDINPNSQTENSKTALCEAAQNGHDAIVWQLLDSGRVDVNLADHIERRPPLHWAARYGRKKVVELLLETDGVDLRVGESRGRTAEILARGAGYSEIADLIHKKANRGVRRNSSGRSRN